MAFAGVVALCLVIWLFYELIRTDGYFSSENMQGLASVRGGETIGDQTMAPVVQPAMVSIDGLASRETGTRGVPTNLSDRTQNQSTSQFYPKVDLRPSSVDIHAPSGILANPADRGNVVRNVTEITRNQGVVPKIAVNGKELPRETVEYGIFENHEFYPRQNEFPLRGKPHTYDPTYKPPRSHFGPMTYPLAGPIGALGMDYIRAGSTDTRVSIASTGGRH